MSEGVIVDGCYILVIVNLLSLAFMRVLSPQTHMINVLWALAKPDTVVQHRHGLLTGSESCRYHERAAQTHANCFIL